MIRCCRENGLEPLIVLQHITHPSWFSRDGGWAAADSTRAFTEYVRFLAPILEDVRYVATMNEPNVLSTLGSVGRLIRSNDPASEYAAISAQHPTQRGLLGAATAAVPDERIVEGLTRAHTAARSVLREETAAQVGWTVSIQPFTAQPGFEEEAAALTHRWENPFLEVSRGDDWVGVQTYTSWMVGPHGPEPHGSRRTQLGWAFQPGAIGDALHHASTVVGEVPLLVTENGVATADDTERVEYLDGATSVIAQAVADDLNVCGYFHWTFMDNFEWVSGFEVSFGLVSVDRETFARTPKRSALWLEQFARTHHSRYRG